MPAVSDVTREAGNQQVCAFRPAAPANKPESAETIGRRAGLLAARPRPGRGRLRLSLRWLLLRRRFLLRARPAIRQRRAGVLLRWLRRLSGHLLGLWLRGTLLHGL